VFVNDALEELRARLREAVSELRSGALAPDQALELIEECERLAREAASEVEGRVRAALEPLPDLPGQLPLAASQA
jgi:exonuclease VII small subunit